MPIYAIGDQEPRIDPSAYVHPDAVVIGDVVIGSESSIWPGAVLRGDDGGITIGDRTSIQDGSVIHTTAQFPTRVGSDCVVGHIVHLEGCTIEDGSLVGSGSVAASDRRTVSVDETAPKMPPDISMLETEVACSAGSMSAQASWMVRHS